MCVSFLELKDVRFIIEMELVNLVAILIYIEILSNYSVGFLIEIAFTYFSFLLVQIVTTIQKKKKYVWWTKQSVKNQEKKTTRDVQNVRKK